MDHRLTLGVVALGCAACFGPSSCCGSKRAPPAKPEAAAEDETAEEVDEAALDRAPSTPSGAVRLIDGMRDGTSAIDGPGLTGYWYAFSDRTGSIQPVEGAPDYPPVSYRGRPARELKGGGQNKWGAGFGFDLGPSPPTASGARAAGWDASAFTGVRFDAASKKGPINVVVELSDGDTSPRGGVCDARSSRPATACYGDYASTIQLSGAEWQTVTLPFSKLALPEWTELPEAKKHGFQRDKVYSIHFKIPATSRPGGALAPFDVVVSGVYFVADGAPVR